MEIEQTPVETIATEIAPQLDRAINDFIARPGGDAESERRRGVLKQVLWDNKVGCLRVAQSYGPLIADLRETLRAVLHHYGPEGAHKVTSHVMAARKARESNEEIDKLERIFQPSADTTAPRGAGDGVLTMKMIAIAIFMVGAGTFLMILGANLVCGGVTYLVRQFVEWF